MTGFYTSVIASCACCSRQGELRFKDELSAREWQISGMCQHCQDDVFHDPDCEEVDCAVCASVALDASGCDVEPVASEAELDTFFGDES